MKYGRKILRQLRDCGGRHSSCVPGATQPPKRSGPGRQGRGALRQVSETVARKPELPPPHLYFLFFLKVMTVRCSNLSNEPNGWGGFQKAGMWGEALGTVGGRKGTWN